MPSQNRVLCLHDLSLSPKLPFPRSLRSTICNPGHPHPMRTLRITNGGHERVKKRSVGRERGDRANTKYCSSKRTQTDIRPMMDRLDEYFMRVDYSALL